VGFLRSVLHYASVAWGLVSGVVANPAQALESVWHFAGSIQTLLDHIVSKVNKDVLSEFLFYISICDKALQDYLRAMSRIARWIWGRQVNPVRVNLNHRIHVLKAWAQRWISRLIAMIVYYYWASITYTNKQVGLERKYRLADIKFARAYALRLVKAALATVQRQAADGYNSQTRQRESIIETIADDLAVRNPLIKTAVRDLVKLAVEAAEIDNPVIRVALGLALSKVVDKLGIDKVMGSLLSTLITDLTGGAKPKTLQAVAADVSRRLTQLEADWAGFMTRGGPEVEQAGQAWKAWSSALGDASLIAFFTQAVVSPVTWAAEVNDTAGRVVGDTVSAIADLVRKA
jgi:hypothetical protein